MSSSPAFSRYSKHRSVSDAEAASDETLPEDLEMARSIIDNLSRQLKVHEDVTANLTVLQKRIEHTHKRNQDAIQTLEDRLDEVEATWVKRLETQHKHWIDEYNRIAKQIENAPRTAISSDREKLKASKDKLLVGLQKRSRNVDQGITELKNVATNRRLITRSVNDDKKRIRDIDARLKALTMKERSLNTQLTNQMKAQLRNPFTELTDEKVNGEYYGVCEITHSYEEMIKNLTEALQALEKIERTSAPVSVARSCKVQEGTPSVDEIDEITIVMKRFLAKLRVQLASAHFSGSPSTSPPIKTGIEKSPPKIRSQAVVETNKKEQKDVKTDQKISTSTSSSSTMSQSAGSAVSKSAASEAPQPASATSEDSTNQSDTTPLNTPQNSSTAANIGKSGNGEDGELSEDSGEEEKGAPQGSKKEIAKPK